MDEQPVDRLMEAIFGIGVLQDPLHNTPERRAWAVQQIAPPSGLLFYAPSVSILRAHLGFDGPVRRQGEIAQELGLKKATVIHLEALALRRIRKAWEQHRRAESEAGT